MLLMGRTLSPETIEKIRQKALGHTRNLGCKLTQAHKDAIARAHEGMKHGEEALKKLRALAERRRGIPIPAERLAKMKTQKSQVMTCPYCGFVGKAGGMQKHHFNHCKKKSIIQSTDNMKENIPIHAQ